MRLKRKSLCVMMVCGLGAFLLVGCTPAPAAMPTVAHIPSLPEATASQAATQAIEETEEAAYPGPGDSFIRLQVNDVGRTFKIHLPPSYQHGEAIPLVINLHGRTSNGFEHEAYSLMSELADREGFIAVYPNALGQPSTWDDSPTQDGQADVDFLRTLIAHLEDELSVDTSRIYISGLSNGGGMANRAACELADKVAAIGTVSGAYYYWETCEPSEAVAVIAFHGTDDKVIPYEGWEQEGYVELPNVERWAADWAMRNECEPEASTGEEVAEVVSWPTWENCEDDVVVSLYTILKGGHVWPGTQAPLPDSLIDASEVMWDFFEAHPKP